MLKALISQLEDMFHNPMQRCRFPDDVLVGPYNVKVSLERNADGEPVLTKEAEDDPMLVFPCSFLYTPMGSWSSMPNRRDRWQMRSPASVGL